MFVLVAVFPPLLTWQVIGSTSFWVCSWRSCSGFCRVCPNRPNCSLDSRGYYPYSYILCSVLPSLYVLVLIFQISASIADIFFLNSFCFSLITYNKLIRFLHGNFCNGSIHKVLFHDNFLPFFYSSGVFCVKPNKSFIFSSLKNDNVMQAFYRRFVKHLTRNHSNWLLIRF